MPTENKPADPFRREDRYIVIKRSDMEKVPTHLHRNFSGRCRALHEQMFISGAPARSFLVIESDWPEYEPAWQMIERRMAGQPQVTAADELDAVLHWRDKHARAIRERDALQLRLNAADQRIDELTRPHPDDDQILIDQHRQFIDREYEDLVDRASDFQDQAYALGLVRGRLETAALREELATPKATGPLCFCGLRQTKNPHPEAGVPPGYLEVGTVYDCIPCLNKSRRAWSKKANRLQGELTAAEQRNAALVELLRELVRRHSEGCSSYGDLADKANAVITSPKKKSFLCTRCDNTGSFKVGAAISICHCIKPTESGASEPNHEIPGTSGARLNMLAKQGE